MGGTTVCSFKSRETAPSLDLYWFSSRNPNVPRSKGPDWLTSGKKKHLSLCHVLFHQHSSQSSNKEESYRQQTKLEEPSSGTPCHRVLQMLQVSFIYFFKKGHWWPHLVKSLLIFARTCFPDSDSSQSFFFSSPAHCPSTLRHPQVACMLSSK